jgi:hypothetical protein
MDRRASRNASSQRATASARKASPEDGASNKAVVAPTNAPHIIPAKKLKSLFTMIFLRAYDAYVDASDRIPSLRPVLYPISKLTAITLVPPLTRQAQNML